MFGRSKSSIALDLITKQNALVKTIYSPIGNNESWDLLINKLNNGDSTPTATSLLPPNGKMELFEPNGMENALMVGVMFDIDKCNIKDCFKGNAQSKAWINNNNNNNNNTIPPSVTLEELKIMNRDAVKENKVIPHNEVLSKINKNGLIAVIALKNDLISRLNALMKQRLVKSKMNVDLPILIVDAASGYLGHYSESQQEKDLNEAVKFSPFNDVRKLIENDFPVIPITYAKVMVSEYDDGLVWESSSYVVYISNWSLLTDIALNDFMLAKKVIIQKYPHCIGRVIEALDEIQSRVNDESEKFYHGANNYESAKINLFLQLKQHHAQYYTYTYENKRLMELYITKEISKLNNAQSVISYYKSIDDLLCLNQHRHSLIQFFSTKQESMTNSKKCVMTKLVEQYLKVDGKNDDTDREFAKLQGALSGYYKPNGSLVPSTTNNDYGLRYSTDLDL